MLKSLQKKSVTYVGYTKNLTKESNYTTQERVQNLPEVENGSLFIKKK